MMIISTPFHLLDRIAAWAKAALVADEVDEPFVDFIGAALPEATRLFCARVFIVSNGYVCCELYQYGSCQKKI